MIHKAKDKSIYVLPESNCPCCGEKFNAGQKLAAESPDFESTAPFPGAWALCESCGEILVYGQAFDLEIPSAQDFERLTTEQWDFMEQIQKQIRGRNN